MKRPTAGLFVVPFLFFTLSFLQCNSDSQQDPNKPPGTPNIENVSNQTISTLGGNKLIISGNTFEQNMTVLFNKIPAKQLRWISENEIEVITPTLLGKTGKISLEVINHIDDVDYPSLRDDLITCMPPLLQFAMPDVLPVKSPIAVKSIQIAGEQVSRLVVLSKSDSNLHILSWNSAKKQFEDQVLAVDWGNGTFGSLLVADSNEDGFSDILLSTSDGTLFIWPIDGMGTIGAPKRVSTTITNLKLWAVGKFSSASNGPDILFSKRQMSDISIGILLNAGSQGFTVSRMTSIGSEVSELLWTDTNQDGMLDAVVRSSWKILVLEGRDTNSFQIPYVISTAPLTVDSLFLFSDSVKGSPLLMIGGINWTNNQYQLTLWEKKEGIWNLNQTKDLEELHSGLVKSDMDGDGIMDMIMPTKKQSVTVVMGDQMNIFTSSSNSIQGFGDIHAILVSDINGDNKPDVIVLENILSAEPRLQWVENRSL